MQISKLKKLIAILAAGLCATLINAQAPDPRYTNTAAQMSAFITNQMATENIVGLGIALVDGDDTVWAQGFGYADKEAGIPVSTGTVFRIGSVSKVFNTTAILTLVDQDLVNLDDPATNYIPELATLPRFAGTEPITVRMLLAHQSGLPGDILSAMFTTAPLTGFLDWLIDYLQTDYPSYPPQLVSVYCNTGFVLAEGVVRTASGTDFTDYARTNVFEPLGMMHSSFLTDSPAISDNLAHPYINGVRYPDEYCGGYGTGGMLASMPDLLRYLRMVNAGGVLDGQRLISTNALAEMTRDNSADCPLNVSTLGLSGLGWDYVHVPWLDYAGPAWVKSGGTMGYTAYIIALPDHDLAVAVAANSRADSMLDTAINTLQWALLDKSGLHWPTNTFVPPFSPVTNRPQTELDDMAGIYVTGDSLDILSAEAGTITWTSGADTENPTTYSNLTPRANGWFSLPDSQELEITVTNLAGETILRKRTVHGPYQFNNLIGQRYNPSPLSAAWSNRVTKMYLVDDMHPLDYLRLLTANYNLCFAIQHGVLGYDSGLSSGYLDTHNDNTAFVLGLQNRGASAIQVKLTNNTERLQLAGYNFIDTAGLSLLAPGATVADRLDDVRRTHWRRIPVREGMTYLVSLQSPDGCQAVATDNTGNFRALSDVDGRLRWRTERATENSDRVNYLGIYGNGYTNGAYTARLTVLNHGGHDFDGDGKADPAVFDYATGILTIWFSDSNYTRRDFQLETSARAILAADCDGDGLADPTLVRQDGTWVAHLSSRGYTPITLPLGTTTGYPLLADVDGDGLADPILVVNGQWSVWRSTDNYQPYGPLDLGLGSGIPVAADFDGDGKADPAMVNDNIWTARLSGSGYAFYRATFDMIGIPTPGDFDGDGKADPAVFNNGWYAWLSGNGYRRSGPYFQEADGDPLL